MRWVATRCVVGFEVKLSLWQLSSTPVSPTRGPCSLGCMPLLPISLRLSQVELRSFVPSHRSFRIGSGQASLVDPSSKTGITNPMSKPHWMLHVLCTSQRTRCWQSRLTAPGQVAKSARCHVRSIRGFGTSLRRLYQGLL